MKFVKFVTAWIKSSFISTDHWLVRVVTTTKDQLGIGMLFILKFLPLILKFLQNQRKKFRQNCELEHNFKNLPFSLILLAIGWVGINIASFSAGFFVVSEILQIQSGTRVLNEIPFEDLVLDAEGIWRNYTYDNYDNNIVNEELYKSRLNRLANKTLQDAANCYPSFMDYKTDVTKVFLEQSLDVYIETEEDGYSVVVAQLTQLFEFRVEMIRMNFEDYLNKYNKLGILSEIADQKLEIILKYGKDGIEHSTQNQMKLTCWASDRLRNENSVVAIDNTIESLITQFETEYFKIYQISVEMDAFFENLFKEYGQGVAPRETPFPFVEVHEAGNLDRIPMQIVIDKKILCDDDVYCPKE